MSLQAIIAAPVCCTFKSGAINAASDENKRIEILNGGFPKFQKEGREEEDYEKIAKYVQTRLEDINVMFNALLQTVEAFRIQNISLQKKRKTSTPIDLKIETLRFNDTISNLDKFSTLSTDMNNLVKQINDFCTTILGKLNGDLDTLAKVKGDSKITQRTAKRRALFDLFRSNMTNEKILIDATSERVYAKFANLNTDGNTVKWSIELYGGAAIGSLNKALLKARTYPLSPITIKNEPEQLPEATDCESSSDDEENPKVAQGEGAKALTAAAASSDSDGGTFVTPESSMILKPEEVKKNFLREPTPAEAKFQEEQAKLKRQVKAKQASEVKK